MEMLAEKFDSLQQVLTEIANPLLVIHPKPDADALGSSFAFLDFLQHKLGKNDLQVFSVDKPGKDLATLFGESKLTDKVSFDNYDSYFVIDRGDIFFKLGISQHLEKTGQQVPIINLDHHPHTFIPGALNIIDTKAAATSEIIYRFFEYVDYEISSKTAQHLLGGIYSDTGGFRHNNTTPKSLEICSNLMRKGASIPKVNRALFANKSISTLKLWAIALERAQINPKTGMAVSFITKEDLKRCNANVNDLDGISEILNSISDSKFSLVLSERERNKIKASLRSEMYKGVDVSKIARKFSGGGHKLASGFEIKGRLRQIGDSWIIE